MIQESRNEETGKMEVNRKAIAGVDERLYPGFEGMNYEQFRQPYNANHKDRNDATDERKNRKRQDEVNP